MRDICTCGPGIALCPACAQALPRPQPPQRPKQPRSSITRVPLPDDEQAALYRAQQQRQQQESRFLAWCRTHHVTAAEANRFLTRQRASLKAAQAQEARLQGRALLWCCGRWHPIVQIPLRVLCCGQVYLVEKTA